MTTVPSRRGLIGGVLTVLATHSGTQGGAAIGALAFPVLGPAGVVAIRQLVASTLLLAISRPRLRRLTWSQWWPILLLAGVFAVMNLSLYTAIDRIGLGLAITLEVLGPLAVALAGSRGVIELLCALGAAAGVYVLVQPGPTTDWLGVGLALFAAGCWSAYIVLNRLLGSRVPGLQGPALANAISALGYVPVLVGLGLAGRLITPSVWQAVAAGLLCSALPYAMDLIVLRTMPTRLFGVLMSMDPLLAAVAGSVILGERLHGHHWVGIATIVAVNAVAVGLAGRSARATGRGPESTTGLVAAVGEAGSGGPAVR